VRIARIIFKAAVTLFGIAIVGLGLTAGGIWLDHSRRVRLPAPTGRYAVGRTTLVWTDSGHADPMAPQPGFPRTLFAWIWYPAAPRQANQAMAEYIPATWRAARKTGFPLAAINLDPARIGTNSIDNGDLSPGEVAYPVIILRGGASAQIAGYTSLAEDLASHGYVVVGFDAPYRSTIVVLPDGRVFSRLPANDPERVNGPAADALAGKLVADWSTDTSFALDRLGDLNRSGRFSGRLDLDRVGAFGHSLGGGTVLQFCHDDPRCKAGIDIDGVVAPGSVVRDGVKQPFMFLLSDHGNERPSPGAPAAERDVKTNIRSLLGRLPANQRWLFAIRHANHFGFGDDVRSPTLMAVIHGLTGTLDGHRQIEITRHYVDAFFDTYLKGKPDTGLRDRSAYPEVESELR